MSGEGDEDICTGSCLARFGEIGSLVSILRLRAFGESLLLSALVGKPGRAPVENDAEREGGAEKVIGAEIVPCKGAEAGREKRDRS